MNRFFYSLLVVIVAARLGAAEAVGGAPPSANAAGALEPRGVFVCASLGNGARAYARTLRADYDRESFRAEVTVTLRGGGGAGCAFFGLGCGVANAGAYDEPSTTPALYLRLAPGDFAGGVVTVSVNGRESKSGMKPAGDGTHRLRLTWDAAARRALFEIDNHWDGKNFRAGSSGTVNGVGIVFGGDARIFVGGANSVRFAEFAVTPLTEVEVGEAGFGESFARDASAGTWLPAPQGEPPPADETIRAVNALLGSVHGTVRLLACWYEGPELAASRMFTNGEVNARGGRWSVDARGTPAGGQPEGIDLLLQFRLAEGRARAAGVAVAFDFEDWSTNNRVMIPASVYNGNRNRIEFRGYCTGFDEGDFYRSDLPVTHGDVPRLESEPGKPSKIEVNASNATTPAIGWFNPRTGRAFLLLAEQGIRFGGRLWDNGLMVEESLDRRRATLVVSAPGVRERKPEFIGFSASPDCGLEARAGDELSMRFRLYAFAARDTGEFLDAFMTARKTVTGPNHPRQLIPASEVIRLMTGRIDGRWHAGPAGGYYGDSNCDDLCLGWVGGLMNTFPMLALGDETHRERAIRTFDFVIPAAVGKAGYFLAAVHADRKASGRDWYPNQPIVLTRQSADVLYWMIKQFLVLKAQGHPEAIKPGWEEAVKGLARAFVATWKHRGQWGNYVNHETGDIAIYNSTGGAMAIGGLALAAKYFNEPAFLEVATQAGDYYYREDFLGRGFTFGACSDIMQNADSETAAGLMTALMTLHETTGDPRWLEMSRNLANLVATWTVSYDYELPPETELARLGAKLAGVYWASTQNKHGAPGICTSAGEALFKIFRATGDGRYAELLRDIVHAHGEGIKPGGEITERLTYCDADSRGSRGGGSTGWNELNGILMALELPGIYVRSDSDEVVVFDRVEARVIRRDKTGATLEIRNPTAYDAHVTVFTENRSEARQPLGPTAFLRWPKVEVKAGATAQTTFE